MNKTPTNKKRTTIIATIATALGLTFLGTGIYFTTNNDNDDTQTVGEATKNYPTHPDVMTENNNAPAEAENNPNTDNPQTNPDNPEQENPEYNSNIPTVNDITTESKETTQFGKEHNYNGLKVTVDTPDQTPTHLCTNVTLNNTTDHPRDYNNLFFALTHDGNSAFPEIGGKSTLSSGSIEPGKTITGTSCFPNGQEGKISYADPETSDLKTWEK